MLTDILVIHRERSFRFVLPMTFAWLAAMRHPSILLCLTVFVIAALIIAKIDNFAKAKLVTILLCTHHVAPPDVVFRFSSLSYPSLYTYAVGGGVRVFDVFVLVLFAYILIQRSVSLGSLKAPLPWLFVFLPIGVALVRFMLDPQLPVPVREYLFLVRQWMFVIALFGMYRRLSSEQKASLAALAIMAWLFTMLFAIIYPQENPWLSESSISYLLTGNRIATTHFTGDEYLSIPTFLAILLVTACSRRRRDYRRYLVWAVSMLLFGVLADRRGVLISFAVVVFMLIESRRQLSPFIGRLFAVVYYYLQPIAQFVVLLIGTTDAGAVIRRLAPIRVPLLEVNIANLFANMVALPFTGIIGFGLLVPYKVFEPIPAFLESQPVWGSWVESPYRIDFNGIPFSNFILTYGIILGGILLIIILLNIIKSKNFSKSYIFLSVVPLFTMQKISLSTCVAIALAWSVLAPPQTIIAATSNERNTDGRSDV